MTVSVSNWPDRRCTARWSSWRMCQWCGPPQWGKAGYHTSSSHRPSPNTLFHCPWLTRAKRLKSCRQRQSRISFLPNLSINASEEFIFYQFQSGNVPCEACYHVDMLSMCCTLHMAVLSLCMRVQLVADWVTQIHHDYNTRHNQRTQIYLDTPGMQTVFQSHLELRQDFAFAWRRNRVHPQNDPPVQNISRKKRDFIN